MPHDHTPKYFSPPTRPRRTAIHANQVLDGADAFEIPATHDGITLALEVAQTGYEAAKDIVSRMSKRRLQLAEEREHETSRVKHKVAKQSWPSDAAQGRAEKHELSGSGTLVDIEGEDHEIKVALIDAEEDLSVFRERMLTLRTALEKCVEGLTPGHWETSEDGRRTFVPDVVTRPVSQVIADATTIGLRRLDDILRRFPTEAVAANEDTRRHVAGALRDFITLEIERGR